MSSGRQTSLTTTLGRWLFAFVVPASAMGIGSLLVSILVPVSILAAIASALLWMDPPTRSSRASRWVLAAFAVLLAMTVLQAIPLPAGLVSAIAPTNADVWQRALLPLHEAGPAWHPLSVAPPATHVELLRGLLYLSIFMGALRIALAEGGSIFLERVVIGSASLVAFTALGHAATHAERVFGIYQRREAGVGGLVGPLLNPNHLAAYLNVGACVAAGAAVRDHRSRPLPLPLAVAAAVLLSGTSVWVGSRGGTASLVLGAVLFGGIALNARRRHGTTGGAELVIVVVALLAAGALLGLGTSEAARADLAGRDVSKLHNVATAAHLVPLSPIIGFGRGAFETMFPMVRTETNYMTLVVPENIVVQWATEWGVPAAVVALGLLVVALRPRVVLTAARPAIGAWVAVFAAVVHDLVDFHLEVPGVVTLVAVCVALIVGGRGATGEGEPKARAGVRTMAFAAALASLGAVVLVWPNIGHSLREDREALSKMSLDAAVSPEGFTTELRGALHRYPAEPYFPLAGAVRAQLTGKESVVPWIARALERYPQFGRAHLVLARSLAPRHRAQARVEYRLAYGYDELLRGYIANEAPYLVDDFDSALELVPEGPLGAEMLETLAAALADRLPATAVQLDGELLARNPTAVGPLRRRVRAAHSDLANDHPWCVDRSRCAEDGIAAAQTLIAAEPEACAPYVLLAELRIANREAPRGLDELARGIESTRQRAGCLRELYRLSLETNEKSRADATLDLALRSGCGTREECLDLYKWAAATEEGRGHVARAISFYKRAAELRPEDDVYVQRVAELAAGAGLVGEAIEAYSKLAMRHPADAQWKARADELRGKSLEQRFRGP